MGDVQGGSAEQPWKVLDDDEWLWSKPIVYPPRSVLSRETPRAVRTFWHRYTLIVTPCYSVFSTRAPWLIPGIAPPALLCHKEPAQGTHAWKGSIIGALLPYEESSRRALNCLELVLYGIGVLTEQQCELSQPMRAKHHWASTNESGGDSTVALH